MSSTPKFYDRVAETSTTTGTGTYTLAGAVTGYQSFAALGDGNSAYYCAMEVDANGNPSGGWEVGLATYTASGTTLSRDTILASTNSNNAVSWSAGTRRIFLTVPAAYTPPLDPTVGIVLRGAKFVRVFGSNLSTGVTDLYTVPTGKRALVMGYSYYNNGAGSIGHSLKVKISGTSYQMTTSVSTSASLFASRAEGWMILEATDVLQINCLTNSGLNAQPSVLEFDDTSNLKGARLVGLSTGNTTLYTCPAGKTAAIVTSVPANFMAAVQSATFGQCGIGVFSDSGGSRAWDVYSVASGGTAGVTNALVFQSPVAASNRSNLAVTIPMGPGDFISIGVDVGAVTQLAFCMVVER